jgi:hypothetical protein
MSPTRSRLNVPPSGINLGFPRNSEAQLSRAVDTVLLISYASSMHPPELRQLVSVSNTPHGSNDAHRK